MKSNKISIFLNLIVVCVLTLSGVYTPAQGAKPIQAALLADDQMPAPLTAFEGLQRALPNAANLTDADSELPDTSGAVDQYYYIQAVNKTVGVFDKGNPAVSTSVPFDTFWTGAGTNTVCDGGNNYHHGQASVVYDHLAERWLIADLAYADVNSGPYYFCIAVLNAKEIPLQNVDLPTFFTGQVPDENPDHPPVGYWWFYALKAQESWPYHLPSHSKFGLWSDGYYLAFDQFDVYSNGQNLTPSGSRVWAINRDDLNSGIPVYRARTSYMPEAMNYHGLIPATLEGNPPTSGTPEFFAAIAPPNQFLIFRFLVNWISPDQSVFNQTPTVLYMNQNYTGAVGFLVPQAGTTEKLNLIGDRLTSLKYREVSQCPPNTAYCTDVAASLWAAHTAMNGSAGVMRWYEIRDPNTSPSFYQQGTYAPNTNTRWVGDLAVDAEGDMALGYSVSNTNMYPSIRYTGRRYSDPLNTLITGEATLKAGTTYQDNANGVPDGKWGLHSAMSVDPVNECVFWYTNEYYSATDANPHTNWHTIIGSFRFPSCGEGSLSRVSLSTADVQGNGSSGIDFEAYSTAVSSNGRYVAFTSEATNLVSGDTNGKRDVFLRDRDADADGIFDEPGQVSTVRISNGLSGTQANNDSWQVSISADGRYIVFSSKADNLAAGDTNGTQDVFLYDAAAKTTSRVSVNTTGVLGNGPSDQPAISGNGRYIAFRSYATNLITGDKNGLADVFFRDTFTGQTTRVSVTDAGAEALGESYSPSITSDGRYVAFASRATNLVAGDGNARADVFIRDRNLGNTVMASVAPDGLTPGNEESSDPSITATASDVRIAFVSRATNLITPASNGAQQIFIRIMDTTLATGVTTQISNSYVGVQGDTNSYAPAISANGSFVVYASDATNLDLQPDNNGVTDIYLRNLDTGLTQLISGASDGTPSNGPSKDPAISGDGQQVIFDSNATNLVSNDTNNLWDVFAYNKRGSIPNFLTIPSNIMGQPGAIVSVPVNFTPNGQQVDSMTFSLDYDETCLGFNNTAGSVVYSVGTAFTAQYSYAATDKDGEIDFGIYPKGTPASTLKQGVIVTVQLTVKSNCQAAPGTSKSVRIGFSKDPQASFGRNGVSIAARTTDGSVSVLSGVQGDCNSDGTLNAGDISALVNEIFDGDGNLPYDAPKSTFPGSPVGCNPNSDVVIDAGDISCMTQILFGHACGGTAASSLKTFSAATLSTDPQISLVGPAFAFQGRHLDVPLQFAANGQSVSTVAFSVSYDPSRMSLDPTDANKDGIPDALYLNLPSGFTAFVTFQPEQAQNQVGVVLVNPNSASAALTSGNLGTFTFQVLENAPLGSTSITFGDNPVVSFGGNGQSLRGGYNNYSFPVYDELPLYIPSISRN